MNDSTRHAFNLLVLTLGFLFILSVMPWSDLTGNRLKNFNLLEDLFPAEQAAPELQAIIDPELEDFLAEATEEEPAPDVPDAPLAVVADSIAADSVDDYHLSVPEPEPECTADGLPLIESYTGGAPLANLREALSRAGEKNVRIAVIGDSFIEGDIFCQNLREMLQERYGGAGVGYMNMHSDFPGFRQSVTQSSQGWKMHDLRNIGSRDSLRTLQGEYGVAAGTATSRYKGASRFEHAAHWSRSTFVFIAPAAGVITLKTADGTKVSHEVQPSALPQALVAEGPTSEFKIESNVPGLVGLGVYLDAPAGVSVDCMSIRGNSGISHRKTNIPLSSQLRQWADYDLIIVEFGINAMSAGQSDYSAYAKAMAHSVTHLKKCYPSADILVMGISDRGAKEGSVVASLPVCRNMVDAQRKIARDAGVYFWDTRAAMGGDGACVDWRKRKLMNADYIHLNHHGGAELAKLLFNAIMLTCNE